MLSCLLKYFNNKVTQIKPLYTYKQVVFKRYGQHFHITCLVSLKTRNSELPDEPQCTSTRRMLLPKYFRRVIFANNNRFLLKRRTWLLNNNILAFSSACRLLAMFSPALLLSSWHYDHFRTLAFGCDASAK